MWILLVPWLLDPNERSFKSLITWLVAPESRYQQSSSVGTMTIMESLLSGCKLLSQTLARWGRSTISLVIIVVQSGERDVKPVAALVHCMSHFATQLTLRFIIIPGLAFVSATTIRTTRNLIFTLISLIIVELNSTSTLKLLFLLHS